MDRFKAARERMVKEQLEARGIKNPRVLGAFRKVPREKFIPPESQDLAYFDGPLPIGSGQTISQPYIVALMTQLLKPEKAGRILEIGTGSGYQAAILAELVREVYTIECYKDLSDESKKILEGLGYRNINYKIGDGTLGWKEKTPFDGIIITAAAPDIPKPLKEQLAEGGRLVSPVGNKFIQELVRLTRRGRNFDREVFGGCRFVPLVGEYGWKE